MIVKLIESNKVAAKIKLKSTVNMHKVMRISHLCNRNTSHHLRELNTQQWQQPLGHDTGIKIYSCISRQMVPLILPNEKFATWYTCGPTVYDATHLGHASCYVKLDIIQRILRQHFGINLVTAMNITDIDDKIIAKSNETGKDWREIVKFHETQFWNDLKNLNVAEPNVKIRVTDNITRIIAFIEKIHQKGNAYIGKDNSVYFEVKRFPNYGKLMRLNLAEPSIASDVGSKAATADFALWKARKAANEPYWDSPWGPGRPGWHIECSVLASMIFGDCIDFHAGGLDLKFPHHENEEAQSCVYHSKEQWINYWIHTGHLNVKGQKEKMSKSLKNTISIDDMLANYTSDAFRMACVLSNYSSSVEYSEELMRNASNTLQKFKSFKLDCQAYLNGQKTGTAFDSNEIFQQIKETSVKVDECFKHDFDTARSVGVLSELISNVSRCINASQDESNKSISASSFDVVAAVDNFVGKIMQNFGFQFAENLNSVEENSNLDIELNAFVEDILKTRKKIRDRAVTQKNKELFQICDDLRNCLKQHGIEIRDHNQGSSWSFNKNKQ